MVSLIEFSSRKNLAVRLASAIWSNLSVFHCEHLRVVRRGDVANDLLCLKTKSLIPKKSEEGAHEPDFSYKQTCKQGMWVFFRSHVNR